MGVVGTGRTSTVGWSAVWTRGVPHRVGECEAVLGCDGRTGSAGGTDRTDVERPFWDAKRDGPW